MADKGPGEGSTTGSSPIRGLPPELLAEIFEHCAIVDTFSPVRLSHVSAFWRCTAITTPCLWHSVSVRIPSSTPRTTTDKVRTWLTRSGCIPVHISLVVTQVRDDSGSFPIFHHLRDHYPHWGRLSVIATSYTIARHVFQFFTSAPSHDILARIDLSIALPSQGDLLPNILHEEEGDERMSITDVVANLMETHAPRLTEFNLATSALPYVFALKTYTGFLHLRTLRILEQPSHLDTIKASTILQLLDKCPSLELFVFRGLITSDGRGVSANMVHLPRLRELHIAQTFHQRTILKHLTTPSLQILRLSWLNRPDEPLDDSYVPDLSQNGEELTEWSQSPYTDLLTGTGLRSLINSGAPPIRILDMDFADARSPKDFVWAFKRLPTLESFRIIGSDMSDKVLYALASKHNSGAWLCPRLTSLEFSRCDVITGRAVLALAKGRNPSQEHVDGKSTEEVSTSPPRPARLKKFTIEACVHVDCESVSVVQHLLGNVDFDVEVISRELYLEEDIDMPS